MTSIARLFDRFLNFFFPFMSFPCSRVRGLPNDRVSADILRTTVDVMVEGELCAEGMRLTIDYVNLLRIPRAVTQQTQLAPASCQQCAAKLEEGPTPSSNSPLEVGMIVESGIVPGILNGSPD